MALDNRRCGPGGTVGGGRTHDLRFKRPLLYQLSYNSILAERVGFEPTALAGHRFSKPALLATQTPLHADDV